MKTKIFKGLFITIALFLFAQFANAQKFYENPKYGTDSASRMECVKNLSLYREYVKQKNYNDALNSWYKVFHGCPAASKNIYLDGVKIFRDLIDSELDPIKKEAHIDTLMKVYDQRMEYFNKPEGFVLGRKAVDYFKYRGNNIDDVEKTYNMLEKSINLRKNNSEEAVLVAFMTVTERLFKEAKIKNDIVIENYSIVIDIIDAKMAAEPDDKVVKAQESVDVIFEGTGAGTCEGLVNLFKPKFEASPNDIKLLERITNLMDKSECIEEDLFLAASEKLFELQPDAKSAVLIAELLRKREDYDKAVKYYLEAINLEESNEQKAIDYIQIADIYRKQDKYAESRNYALQAADADPKNGQPYLIIGHLYASSSSVCSNDELEKAAIYWAAVDKYAKAKTVDPSLTEEANKYINTYTAYFPKKETLFFFSAKAGDTYKLGCWINESTIVRINE